MATSVSINCVLKWIFLSLFVSHGKKKYFLLFSSESTRLFYIRPPWHAKAKLNYLWPEQKDSFVRVNVEPNWKAFCMIGSYTSCSFSGVTSCNKSELSQQTKQEVQVANLNLLLFGSISMVFLCTQIILAILLHLYVHVIVVSHHPAGHFINHKLS